MTLTEILTLEANGMYATAERLMRLVQPDELSWKPATGKNWMTMAQLLRHCAEGCGAPIKGFVTGDWGMPEGMKAEEMSADEMLPPAEKMAAVQSVEEALRIMGDDRKTALKYIAEAGETNLLTRKVQAPWGGPEMPLFQQLHSMIYHLGQHKGQLFYYLKLMGKNVNTADLWGM